MNYDQIFWLILVQAILLISTNTYAYSSGYGKATREAVAKAKKEKMEKPKDNKDDLYAPRYSQKDFLKQREEDRKYVAEHKGKVQPLNQKNQRKSDAIDKQNQRKKVK